MDTSPTTAAAPTGANVVAAAPAGGDVAEEPGSGEGSSVAVGGAPAAAANTEEPEEPGSGEGSSVAVGAAPAAAANTEEPEGLGEMEGASLGVDNTERPKLVACGFNKYLGRRDVERSLAQQGLGFSVHKVTKIPKRSMALLTFKDTDEADKALQLLKKWVCKGRPITVTRSGRPTTREEALMLMTKRGRSDEDDPRAVTKKPREVKGVVEATCPWFHMSYEDQLAQKEKAMLNESLLKMQNLIKKEMIKRKKSAPKEKLSEDKIKALTIPEWLAASGGKELAFQMDPILAAPKKEGYRNKCEFSIAKDEQGKPVVGFRQGAFEDGCLRVGRPTDCPHVPPVMKELCLAVEDFLASSPFQPYNLVTHTGVWRQLTVRLSEASGEVMAFFIVSLASIPKPTVDGEEWLWDKEKARMIASLCTPPSNGSLSSLHIQPYDGAGCPEPDDPMELVHGTPYIHEKILGQTFRISPGAFFQVNTQGAEVLYKTVVDHLLEEGQAAERSSCTQGDTPAAPALQGDSGAAASAETPGKARRLILDVCCGTGTIGLCCAQQAAVNKGASEDSEDVQLIGVELCKAATDDAEANAVANGITNARFICAKAETAMKSMLKESPNEPLRKVSCVVDPPRAGLHPDVLIAIRECSAIDRVVYISCNPRNSLPPNANMLCQFESKKFRGKPFRPVKAMPVDLFPHTPHCEMVVVFER